MIVKPYFRPTAIIPVITLASILFTHWASAALLEEVIVTAQKRQQDAQDVGIAISSFSNAQMRSLGVTDAADLADLTSGVTINMEYGTAPLFAIRGVSVNDFAATTPPAAAVYLDGVYKASNINSGPQMFDMERVEILKGPQGTLWGRNTTGGAISITSVKPSQESDGFIEVGYGTHDHIQVEGAFGAGLTDNLSTRLSFRYMESDGAFDSVTNGEHGALDNVALRGQLLLETGNFTGQLIAHYAQDKGEIEPTVAYILGSCSPAAGIVTTIGGVPVAGDPEHPSCGNSTKATNPFDDTVSTDWNSDKNNKFYGATVKMDWDIGENLSIHSTSAYDGFERLDGLDFEGTSTIYGRQIYDQEFDQFSQELRLEGQLENGFWLLGYYFDNSEIKDPANLTPVGATYDSIPPDFNAVITGAPLQPGDGSSSYFGGFPFDLETFQETTVHAAFAHVEFGLVENLRFIGGVRYEDEDKKGRHADLAALPGAGPVNDVIGVAFGGNRAEQETSFNDVSWKAGLNYQATADMMLYGTYSVGVKSGGTDQAFAGFNNPPFGKETLKALEGGIKWDVTDNLRFNASAYWYDYEDMVQRFSVYITNEFGDPVGAERLDNVEAADVYGLDLELTFAPAEALEFLVTATFLDTEVDDEVASAGLIDSDGSGGPSAGDTVVSIDGNELPFAPDVSITGVARYLMQLDNDYSMSFQVNVSHSSDHFISIENVPFEEQDHTKLGAHVALMGPGDKWSLSVTGTNLTNEFHAINGFPSGLGGRAYYINTPRTVIGRLSYNFF